ncbi:hypothetical protein KEJ19_05900 [Candidatus Bathyarchaeota archaeon]|nr:hypothetical protein [Candidatus Bathyarchaeota archaeon]
MGHIYVEDLFYNPSDYVEYVQGKRKLEDVKKFKCRALVDTGATFPALPENVVKDIDLPFIGEYKAEVAEGIANLKQAYVVAQINGKVAVSNLIIRPEGTTPLIGVVTLEQMGYKVDLTTGKLVEGLPLLL